MINGEGAGALTAGRAGGENRPSLAGLEASRADEGVRAVRGADYRKWYVRCRLTPNDSMPSSSIS